MLMYYILIVIMNFHSIRSKVILLFIPLIVVPILLGGVIGAVYFQDTLKHNIWDDNLAQAKTISAFTASYVNLSENYLTSIANRPLVITAVEEGNQSFLNETTQYTTVKGLAFDTAFITDNSGKVLSYNTIYSNRSYPSIIGKNYYDRPYIGPVLNTSNPSVVAMRNDIDGTSSIYVGVPIRALNNTTIGAIVGTFDMGNYTSMVIGTSVKNGQNTYLVNESGNIILHNNKSYMNNMTDFSSVPAVQDVIQGKEGVEEDYNPVEQQYLLAAYSPVNGTGWGVIVAVPTSVAYQPVTNMLWLIAAVTLALAVIALALAYVFSKSIVDPIMGLFEAAKAITDGREYKQFLPLKRKDEIGQVGVCIDKMAQSLSEDREKLLTAKNGAEMEKAHAEEEKNRSDFYVDVMGHDINNLNQATYGYLELLQADKTLTEEQRRLVDNAINPLLGSSSIIGNVRKVQEITSGKQSLEKLDINSLISQCIKEVHKPSDKKVVINYSPKEGRFVNAIPLLKDVFCNLIDNSIKYSGPEVAIDIIVDESFSEGKKFHVIFISDNGNGIPDSIKQKIFRRLQRGTTKAHGRGLGLFIVKTLVERVGGSVTVEDRVPGDYTKGSKFIVKLPVFEG